MVYDFTDLYKAISIVGEIATRGDYVPDSKFKKAGCENINLNMESALQIIKRSLNKFFPDKKCLSVIYTPNIDNEFFGIIVKPTSYSIQGLFIDNEENGSFTHYMVEFDGKLFNPATNWTVNSIMTGLLHDVYEVTNTKTVKEINEHIDAICCGLNVVPNTFFKTKFISAFKYCIEEAVYRLKSIYNKSTMELNIWNELLQNYHLSEYYDYELERIQSLRSELDKINKCDSLMLNWFFYWAKNSTDYDTAPIYIFRKAVECTGSLLMKNSAYTALNGLGSTDFNSYVEESTKNKKKGFIGSLKLNGMKSLEDDLYEYCMRIKNIDDEASAIQLMRQINSRMGIISDYICEEELSEHERKRWESLYDKYDKLREEMVKKPIYSRKMYGLFVDYNALMSMNAANYATLNTMY